MFKAFCEDSVNVSRPSHIRRKMYTAILGSRDKASPLKKETGSEEKECWNKRGIQHICSCLWMAMLSTSCGKVREAVILPLLVGAFTIRHNRPHTSTICNDSMWGCRYVEKTGKRWHLLVEHKLCCTCKKTTVHLAIRVDAFWWRINKLKVLSIIWCWPH